MQVKIKKLVPHAEIPKRAKNGDAAYDIVATDYCYDAYHEFHEYGTGLSFEFSPEFVGLLFCRSSISKKRIALSNAVGVLDSSYRGEVTFRFRSIGKTYEDDLYDVGDRIGQIMFIKREDVDFIEVDELTETSRGSGGYGSSGK